MCIIENLNTHLGMKNEHERKIMDFLFQISLIPVMITNIDMISKCTDIPRSSLQRIFPRLEKRGWIEKNATRKHIGAIPCIKIADVDLLSHKDNDGNTLFAIPNASKEKYLEELSKLTREYVSINDNRERIVEKISYSNHLKTFDIRKRRRIEQNDSLRFKGKTALQRKYKRTTPTIQSPNGFIYYIMKKYPYLIIKNNKLKMDLKSDFNIPYGKKRFWKKNAKEWKQKYENMKIKQ